MLNRFLRSFSLNFGGSNSQEAVDEQRHELMKSRKHSNSLEMGFLRDDGNPGLSRDLLETLETSRTYVDRSGERKRSHPTRGIDKQILSNKMLLKSNTLLHLFQETCTYLHSFFFVHSPRPDRSIEATEIPRRLDDFVKILVEEETMPEIEGLTRSRCLEHALEKNLFYELAEAGGHDQPVGTTREILRTFNILTKLLGQQFLKQNQIHVSLMQLIEYCIDDTTLSAKMGDHAVELIFTLCSQLKHYPDLLPFFFYDEMESRPSTSPFVFPGQRKHRSHRKPLAGDLMTQNDSPQKQRLTPPVESVHQELLVDQDISQADKLMSDVGGCAYDFPLFRYALHFVERQGRVGELAKAGLIDCIEVSTEAVSQYIVERSEFCKVLIGGLCAMYNQLPKVTLEDEQVATQGIHLNTIFANMVSQLEFCQSLIKKADPIVCKAILTTFHSKFLGECICNDLISTQWNLDVILNYVNDILLILSEENLSRLIIDFFLSWNLSDSRQVAENPLVIEILLDALKSGSDSSKLSVLRLFFIIISSHYSVSFLHIHRLCCKHDWLKLNISKTSPEAPSTLSLIRPPELQRFYDLLDPTDDFQVSEAYLESYINDAEQIISFRLEKLVLACNKHWEIKAKHVPGSHYSHENKYSLIDILLAEMTKFIDNSLELNLVLTGVLSQIAMCPDPLSYNLLYHRDLSKGSRQEISDTENAKQLSLFTCLSQLRTHFHEVSRTIPDFDNELEKERESLNRTRQLETDSIYSEDFLTREKEETQLKHGLTKRMVLLEEFIKELTAILQVHLLQLYHQPVDYGSED